MAKDLKQRTVFLSDQVVRFSLYPNSSCWDHQATAPALGRFACTFSSIGLLPMLRKSLRLASNNRSHARWKRRHTDVTTNG
jgi:hypothetical protein